MQIPSPSADLRNPSLAQWRCPALNSRTDHLQTATHRDEGSKREGANSPCGTSEGPALLNFCFLLNFTLESASSNSRVRRTPLESRTTRQLFCIFRGQTPLLLLPGQSLRGPLLAVHLQPQPGEQQPQGYRTPLPPPTHSTNKSLLPAPHPKDRHRKLSVPTQHVETHALCIIGARIQFSEPTRPSCKRKLDTSFIES